MNNTREKNKENKRNKIEKNLKHGYIFLTCFILISFLILFTFEIYREGFFTKLNLRFSNSSNTISTSVNNINNSKPSLQLLNIKDGFQTYESTISIVGSTDTGNIAVINNTKVSVDDSGRFESKINLIIGQNQITLTVNNKFGLQNSLSIFVTRMLQPQTAPITSQSSQRTTQENPRSNPPPVKTPSSQPASSSSGQSSNQITSLRLRCSITNTHPSIGQNVSINCNVTNQKGNGVSSAFGYVTINWSTGSSIYTLSQSNLSVNMSTSFNVPSKNSGKSISGNIQVSKNALNVSSGFNLSIQ